MFILLFSWNFFVHRLDGWTNQMIHIFLSWEFGIFSPYRSIFHVGQGFWLQFHLFKRLQTCRLASVILHKGKHNSVGMF